MTSNMGRMWPLNQNEIDTPDVGVHSSSSSSSILKSYIAAAVVPCSNVGEMERGVVGGATSVLLLPVKAARVQLCSNNNRT